LTGCRVVDGTREEARCARRDRFQVACLFTPRCLTSFDMTVLAVEMIVNSKREEARCARRVAGLLLAGCFLDLFFFVEGDAADFHACCYFITVVLDDCQ
jgi:hypothetical protein